MTDAEEKYADIIDHVYTGPAHHKRMSEDKRAAQFMPFAALTGFGEAADETARLTETKRILTESRREELDAKMAELEAAEHSSMLPGVAITYFMPDRKKAGGSYVTAHGKLRKIDHYAKILILEDGTCIPAEDVWAIEYEEM